MVSSVGGASWRGGSGAGKWRLRGSELLAAEGGRGVAVVAVDVAI